MGSTTLSPSMKLMILLVLLTSTVSLALDMSIISYDKTHPDKSTQRTDKEVMNMYEEWLVKHGKSYNALGEKTKDSRSSKITLNSSMNITVRI
jgi:hypothetical protein